MPVVAVVVNLTHDGPEGMVEEHRWNGERNSGGPGMPVQVMEMVMVIMVMHLVELDLVVVDHWKNMPSPVHKEAGQVVLVLSSSHIQQPN